MGRAIRAVAAAAAALLCAAPASALTDGARRQQAPRVQQRLEFVWPAQGFVTTGFGHTQGRWHPGIDIGMLRSLTVRAAVPGVVERVGYVSGFAGYGNIVLIAVRPGLETLYAHLSSHRVRPGQRVRRGVTLGVAGCTGYCTGTHLHFEVRRRGRAVDPMRFLG